MKKLYNALPGVVFVLFLAVMAVLFFLLPDKDQSEREKRVLAQKPDLSAQSILKGDAQEDLEDYISDQIPGRDFFVGVNAYWTLLTGRNAAQDIYHAADGYLINAPKDFSMEVFTNNMLRFDEFAAQLGLPADLILVPTTGCLMEDKLPSGHGAYQDDALYERAENTLDYIRLLDVREPLLAGKETGQVCYRTDHHLTSYGNYLLYRAFQTYWNREAPARETYTVTAYDGFYGTTWSGSGYWLTDPDQVETWDSGEQVTVTFNDGKEDRREQDIFYLDHLSELDKYPVFMDGNHSLVTIENPGAQGGSILVIRDSFGHCFSTFLTEGYQTVYLVDLRYYRLSLSDFLAEHPVDQVLFLYGMDTIVSDTNSAWLQ